MYDFEEMRCSRCGRFLGHEAIIKGIVFLKCGKCGAVTILCGSDEDLQNIINLLKEEEVDKKEK